MREYEQEEEKRKIQKKNKNWLKENFDTRYRNRKTSSDIDENVSPRVVETERQRRHRLRRGRRDQKNAQGQTDC